MNTLALWLLPALLGVTSYHDGANCHNAVLAGKGYTNDLLYTDAVEMRYYLEHFCTPSINSEVPGTVLTISRKGQLDHSAIAIGEDRIFDKNSIAGETGLFDPDGESVFTIRSRSMSRHFTGCGRGCVVEAFQCRDYREVGAAVAQCLNTPTGRVISRLRAGLSEITRNPEKIIQYNPSHLADLEELLAEVSDLKGHEPCALFYLALSYSLDWNLWILNQHQDIPDSWWTVLNDLHWELPALRDRVRAHDSSPRTARILHEFLY